MASGSYRKYGLEVTIREVAPPADPVLLVAAGEADFRIDGNSYQQLDHALDGIAVLTIAAMLQKDPMAVLAPPGASVRRFEDLRGRKLRVAGNGRGTVWPWLRGRYGLDDTQLAEPGTDAAAAVTIGDVIDERFAITSRGGADPVVLLPANDIYYVYDGTVQATARRIQEEPELVQRFVDATIEGWYHYLYGDHAEAEALILAANRDMSVERLAHALSTIRRYGLVDSSHALTMGIGAMDGGRWGSFCADRLGKKKHDVPFDRLYSLQFVNQGHGLALKERLVGG
jgi:NitT/TauT family transport system substrate-binding protein